MHSVRVVLVFAAVAAPSVARAIGLPGLELFGGYAYTRVRGDDPKFEPGRASLHGFEASLTLGARSRLSLVAEASGHFGALAGADLTRWSILAGPRMSLRARLLTVFVHTLAGAVRTRESLTVADLTIGETATDFAGAAGGGIDLRLSDRWAIRLQGDVTLVRAEKKAVAAPRLAIGLAFRTRR